MSFLGWWVIVCLTAGIFFFFFLGIYFFRKEMEWSRFEKSREIWHLLSSVVAYLEERNPELSPGEMAQRVKEILALLEVTVNMEIIESVMVKKKTVL